MRRLPILLLLLCLNAIPVAARDWFPDELPAQWNAQFSAGRATAARRGDAETQTLSIDWSRPMTKSQTLGLALSSIKIEQPADWENVNRDTVDAWALQLQYRYQYHPDGTGIRPYAEVRIGPCRSEIPVPHDTTRSNLLSEIGLGAIVYQAREYAVTASGRFLHVSNAGTYNKNPGWSFYGATLGVRW